MRNQINALIFDFDGLILDTESPEVDGWKAIYAEYGLEFPIQVWVSKVIGASLTNFDPAANLAKLTGLPLDQPALLAKVRFDRLETQDKFSAMPGVSDYVKDAKGMGLRLGIASSSEHAWVEGYLQKLGLLGYFDAIVCREDVKAIKPDPELFLAATAALNESIDQTLAFEDSPNGVLAASRAGLRVVAVPNKITVYGTFPGATFLLNSMAEMPLKNLLQLINLEFREEKDSDIPGIRNVEMQAFGRSSEANLVDLCRDRSTISLSLVADDEGEIMGHILFTPVSLVPGHDSLKGLGLGPIAVKPEHQRAGIGTQLMRHGLELCRQRDYDFVVLLGDPAYYNRFGFKPAKEYGLSCDYEEDDAFQVVELRKGSLNGTKARIKYVPEFSEVDV